MRYLPHTDEDIAAMLGVVGVKDLDALFAAVPADCRMSGELQLPPALTEWELDDHMDRLAGYDGRLAGVVDVPRRGELRPPHPRGGLLACWPVPSL